MPKKILVTGATGYIGSHTCVTLLQEGYTVVGLDNLSNSSQTVISRIEQITGRHVPFFKLDVRDRQALDGLLNQHKFDAVLHFAGLKSVGESAARPLAYFQNNVAGTLTLLEAMSAAGIKCFVFSSSATVYGDPEFLPIGESGKLRTTNPYGRTKLIVEEILSDLLQSDPAWRIGVLRYFNPVGAHDSGLIGEDPKDAPNNLMPYIAQVAAGKRQKLNVYGDDYPTPDGTGVRDYIHVMDLARGHVAALARLLRLPESFTVNLGTGKGYSVLEVLRAFEIACGRTIPYSISSRRHGDVATCYADPAKAKKLLQWTAEKSLENMCADHWRWQSMNPDGYR